MKKINGTVLFICIILFFIPFFWFKPGELELGGDSNRLYLYDPGSYLRVSGLYSVEPQGQGKVMPNQDVIPFLLFLQFFSSIVRSPYIVMCLLNSLKLVGSFLFVYLIVVEILKHHSGKESYIYADRAGILAGLFYMLSPSVGANMHAALLTHNQVFLNPMIFYLMLRFFLSHKDKYLWILLLVTLIFSPNFSLNAPPPPFAFYPLASLFIGLYITIGLKKTLPWKKLYFGLLIFLGLHAFHIVPILTFVFDPGSYFHARILDATAQKNEALNYFNAVLGQGRVSTSLFPSYSSLSPRWSTVAVPLVIVVGFLLNRGKQRGLALIVLFFFMTLFLISANVTQIGVEFYRKLFYIPGFGMFRVFYGQWQWAYAFFYALLFGYQLCIVFSKLKVRYISILSFLLVGLFLFNSWAFISGDVFKVPLWGSNNMTNIIKMNPDYEQALKFFRGLPDDGKVFNFPFTDFGYQLIPGINKGAYIGVSPTAYLAGKRDFSGYQDIYPFPEVFLKLIKEKNYSAIKHLFGILNVKYIFYIADPKAYQEFFPAFPYSLFLQAVPDPQSLDDLVEAIAEKKIFGQGDYNIYQVDTRIYLPHFYVPVRISLYDNTSQSDSKNTSFFINKRDGDPRVGYIEHDICVSLHLLLDCNYKEIEITQEPPIIHYQRLNPTKYVIDVSGAIEPFVLIFSEKFHKDWKVYISPKELDMTQVQQNYFNADIRESYHKNEFVNDKTFETWNLESVPDEKHFLANGYANGWEIEPERIASGENHFSLIIELTQQRIFYYSLGISLVSIGVFLLYGIQSLKE